MDHRMRRDQLEEYLSNGFGGPVRVRSIVPLGREAGEKGFGYGAPVRVDLGGAPVEAVVVHTAGSGGFGHDTLADRAAAAVLAYETFNNLPRHVRAVGLGVVNADGKWISLGEARGFFLITEYEAGEPYFKDLDRIANTSQRTEADLRRVERLARCLIQIHTDRNPTPALYLRRTRELFGHHECILGLLDSYDAFPLEEFTSAAQLREIERRCVDWRRRLKGYSHRLCRVHGDFHPWNVLWRPDGDFTLLDRSRGEWGEAADDVSCMAINYLFFSLRAHGELAGPFQELWNRFFETYLAATRDQEILQVIPPYFIWRALVLASTLWYPALDADVRRLLFRFIDRLLDHQTFEWRNVNALLAETSTGRASCDRMGE